MMSDKTSVKFFYKREDIKDPSLYNDIVNKELCDENYREKIIEDVLKADKSNIREDFAYIGHNNCFFETEKRTEKRLCRCLVCYNNDSEDCKKCKIENVYFRKKIKNVEAVDFEIPVSQDGKDSIGNIDLLLKYNNDYYCVEVKPVWNNESILRMVSEIVTYTHMLKYANNDNFQKKYNVEIEKLKKGILFMDGSYQQAQWTGMRNGRQYKNQVCQRLKDIIEKEEISVFCLSLEGEEYKLEKLN